ncbi:hypothetical protein [Pilimelia terevasa]|uniref:hypothetical protein n=1 Tax=Pilimelia terevasa TaxID=53372 RepID=UPI00166557C0|nr:hypothetical protein [Pilimelia terevasa]
MDIGDLTTETDRAWARPDGTIEWEHRFRPVRVKRDGGWRPVDLTLEKRSDGSVGPRVAAADVAFAGGGSHAMVTMGHEGDRVGLDSPTGALPEPQLSGDTAVYRDVLPGVDLQLRADVDGFAQVFVVKTPQAAKQSALRKLRFGLRGEGLAVRKVAGGNLSVVDDSGETAFVGGTPLMWDASSEHAIEGDDRLVADTGPVSTVTMPVSVADGALSITPDVALLTDEAVYPIFIDPSMTAPRRTWGMVNSAAPNTSYYNSTSEAMIGTPNAGATIYRSYFAINADSIPWDTNYVVSSTLNIQNTYSASCTPTAWGAYSVGGSLNASTTWNNPMSWKVLQHQTSEGYGRTGCGDPTVVKVPLTDLTRAYQTSSAASIAFGVRALSETETRGYKRFSNNPTLTVVYTAYSTASLLATSPLTACPTGTIRGYVGPSPTLQAKVTDPEGGQIVGQFEWTPVSGGTGLLHQLVTVLVRRPDWPVES